MSVYKNGTIKSTLSGSCIEADLRSLWKASPRRTASLYKSEITNYYQFRATLVLTFNSLGSAF